MGQGASACFGRGMSEEKREQERIASQEARAKAAEAAQRRQLQFEQSAIGRAALAQAAKEKQSTSNSGEPNLKVTAYKHHKRDQFSWSIFTLTGNLFSLFIPGKDSKCGFVRDCVSVAIRKKSLKCRNRVPYRGENAVRPTQKPL